MGANVARAPIPFHGPRRASALFRLSKRWGCSEKTAKIRLYGEQGIFAQAADVVEVLSELGETERLANLTARYEAAMTGTLPHWSELLREYGRADGLEDAARAELSTVDPNDLTDEQLAKYKKQLAHEILWANRMLATLEQVERRRKEQQ